MSAILDNTLNFKAKVTTERDKKAYKKLQSIVKDKGNYAEKYFLECQLGIENNIKKSIENDTKIEKINETLPPVFGQLTIWDKKNILDNKKIIYETLNDIGDKWMMNLICLKEGKSYIISPNLDFQKKLEQLLEGKFEKDIMSLKKFGLEKK